MRFETGAPGPAPGLVWSGKRAPRAEPFEPSVEALREFAGVYYSEEIETTLRFGVEGDQLVARQFRWGSGSLGFRPLARDEFRGRTLITHAQFIRDAAGQVAEVLISVRRAHHLRFVKLDRLLRSSLEDR